MGKYIDKIDEMQQRYDSLMKKMKKLARYEKALRKIRFCKHLKSCSEFDSGHLCHGDCWVDIAREALEGETK